MAKIYNAPKPRYSAWEWFKYVGFRVVFPPVLLWDLMKFGANKLLGEFVGSMVLPAQGGDFSDLAVTDENIQDHNHNADLVCEKYEVITHDGANLDTFEIRHQSQKDKNPQHKKYIINLVGNGMCYEHIIEDMKKDARDLQANVIGFNLRGVGQSNNKKPQSKDDLVVDCIAQVQRLLDDGVSPENITLKGHSLGGGIATLTAKHFHQLGQPINLFNSRSFSSITNFLVGHKRLELDERGDAWGHKDSTLGIFLGWLAKPFIKFGVSLAKWEINAGSAYKSIPEEYKDYIVVRSRKKNKETGEEIRENRLDDGVIPHYASIHKELTSERQDKKDEIDTEIENLNHMIQTADPLAKPGLHEAKQSLVQAREKIKTERKMETDRSLSNGHNEDWNAMHNRNGKSAHTFFTEFVQRAEQDHGVKSTAVVI